MHRNNNVEKIVPDSFVKVMRCQKRGIRDFNVTYTNNSIVLKHF